MGILKREKGKVYPGIVLDHDLDKNPASENDLSPCNQDVVGAIIMNVLREVPILVHSVNVSQSPVMNTMLEKTGFAVGQISIDVLTRDSFNEWLA